MVRTIEKKNFNFFIGYDLIGSIIVSAILPLELLIADYIKEIILICIMTVFILLIVGCIFLLLRI